MKYTLFSLIARTALGSAVAIAMFAGWVSSLKIMSRGVVLGHILSPMQVGAGVTLLALTFLEESTLNCFECLWSGEVTISWAGRPRLFGFFGI